VAPPGPPTVTVRDTPLSDSDAPVLATAVRAVDGQARTSDAALAFAETLGLDLPALLEHASATGAAGQVVEAPITHPGSPVRRLLLVGAGDDSPSDARRAGAALARRAAGAERVATDTAAGLDAEAARAHVEGTLLAAYAISRPSGDAAQGKAPVQAVDLHLPGRLAAPVRAAVDLAGVTGRSVHLARDLANTPSNVKDPAWLAKQARDLGRRHGLEVTVRDEKQLASEGFGGIVGVGMGSARPPRLVEMRYTPARSARRAPHVVLVGKGITFDSGGLSLKPRDSMVAMKTDMAAGGAVIAVMTALRDAGVRARVTGLVAAAENLPGASALRPGDVITHYGGRTVEVFNTDAEGRLVLADALAYADAELDPDLVVDMATLTGAASLGLGRRHGALYTGDEDLARGLLAAGDASGDRLWRMPLVEDYRAAMDSEIADLSNISRDPHISGGSITAALFLREFAGARRWAHLDIAGPARADRDEHEVSKGGTGYGTRLLLRWLEDLL
jgi:leucyl aminopeptidase